MKVIAFLSQVVLLVAVVFVLNTARASYLERPGNEVLGGLPPCDVVRVVTGWCSGEPPVGGSCDIGYPTWESVLIFRETKVETVLATGCPTVGCEGPYEETASDQCDPNWDT